MKLLNTKELNLLIKKFGVLNFPNEFDLIYENQIPNTGIALVNGELVLNKKSKIIETLKPGHMLGIYELINSQPLKHGLKVMADSVIVLINRSDLLEVFATEEKELVEIFNV